MIPYGEKENILALSLTADDHMGDIHAKEEDTLGVRCGICEKFVSVRRTAQVSYRVNARSCHSKHSATPLNGPL